MVSDEYFENQQHNAASFNRSIVSIMQLEFFLPSNISPKIKTFSSVKIRFLKLKFESKLSILIKLMKAKFFQIFLIVFSKASKISEKFPQTSQYFN